MTGAPQAMLGGPAVGPGRRPVRAVVYGVGAMGSIMTRLLVEKGAQLVGAIGRSPGKVGRDLGDVAGLGFKLGVCVGDDPAEVMAHADDPATIERAPAETSPRTALRRTR